MIGIDVGDVLAVRTGTTWVERMIDVGAAIRGVPSNANHIVVAHHRDSAGVWWGVEGKPGGVGWADLRRYLTNGYTTSNADQPKNDIQRQHVADLLVQMLGTPYDWSAIADDAFNALGLPDLFAQDWHGQGAPGHVVCSSLAAYAYGTVQLAMPVTDDPRHVTPGDWAQFNTERGWQPK